MEIDFDVDRCRCQSISIKYDEQTAMGFSINLKQEIDDLTLIFIKLSEMTREIRLSKYLDELDTLGYFRYSGMRFFQRNNFIEDDKEYSAKDFYFYKVEGKVYLKRKQSTYSLWNKLINYIFDMKSINFTILDKDIIFPLLVDKCDWKWD